MDKTDARSNARFVQLAKLSIDFDGEDSGGRLRGTDRFALRSQHSAPKTRWSGSIWGKLDHASGKMRRRGEELRCGDDTNA